MNIRYIAHPIADPYGSVFSSFPQMDKRNDNARSGIIERVAQRNGTTSWVVIRVSWKFVALKLTCNYPF